MSLTLIPMLLLSVQRGNTRSTMNLGNTIRNSTVVFICASIMFLCLGERPIVYAKDIVIANLPPSVDQLDVMLLTKRLALNPIHISPIETTGIKYNM
jgi:hypothetical protein